MPRFKAEKGLDFVRRAYNNVMASYNNSMVLASANKMYNPDFTDFDAEGKLEGWTLLAPDRPDHWNVYIKQLTRVTTSGTTKVGGNFMRQNTSKLGMDEKLFQLEDPLISGAPITNATKGARIAPPGDIPDARAVLDTDAVGWAAGTWFFGFAWILGRNPVASNSITNASPAASVVLGQGQMPQITMPTNAPEGATGVALLGGPSATSMSIQKRYDIRTSPPKTVILDRYNKGGQIITTTGTNSTYVGGALPYPASWWARADTTLYPMRTRVAYKVLTDQGWSQISFYSPYIINEGTYPGWQLCWKPNKFPPGTKRWLPVFESDDLSWYTVPLADFAGAEGIPTDYSMCINHVSSNQDDWTYGGKPERVELNNADETGIAGPDEALELLAVGGITLTPGDYAIKTTFGVDDEETSPSPQKVVTLRHIGGGLTDQMFQIARPSEQLLKNNRFEDKDRNGIDLFWSTTPNAAGLNITSLDNEVQVQDTTGSATDIVARECVPFDINPNGVTTVRSFIDVTRYTSGAAAIAIQFLNDANSVLGSARLGNARSTGEKELFRTFGGAGKKVDIRWPNGTTKLRYQIVTRGSTSHGTRNLDFKVYHIAVFRGANSRKRYPVDFALYNDNSIGDRRSDDPERKMDSYPNGPYCRVVRNPRDPARTVNPTELFPEADMETGTIPSGWTQTANGGTIVTYPAEAAIHGDFGMRIAKTDSTAVASNGYIVRSTAARSNGFIRFFVRPEILPTSGTVTLTQIDTGTNIVMTILLSSTGELTLSSWNGTALVSTQLLRRIEPGQRILIEAGVTGQNTNTTNYSVRVKEDTDPQFTVAINNQNSSTRGQLTRFFVGAFNGASGANYTINIDDIFVTTGGEGATGPVPGNYVEYWAPEGQPRLFRNFMCDAQVPVKPNTTYTLSAFVGSENVPSGTEPLSTTVRDSRGSVVRNNGPLCKLSGDRFWKRYKLTFTTGSTGRILQFDGGQVGGGLIRAMGFQLDEGSSMTPFDNTNALNGFFDVAFDTKLNGGAVAPIMDSVTAWLRANSVVTHEYDANNLPLTTMSNQFRGASTVAGLDSAAWHGALSDLEAAVGRVRYVEVRTNMTSNSNTLSPTIRSVFFDVKRHRPMLYRGDGSEFTGGVLVHNFPAPQKRRNVVQREYADGSTGFEDVGRGSSPVIAKGFALQAFTDEAVSEIADLQGFGDGTFIVEFHNRRYKIRFFNASFEASRSNWKKIGNTMYWVHNATGIEAEVIGEEVF